MCSRYQAEKRRALLERRFGTLLPKGLKFERDERSHVYPTQFAPIIRRPAERDSGDEAVHEFEIVDAQFGLLPTFAKDVKYGTRTYNAPSETATSLASFKTAWAKPRHCIVPCEAIYEPDGRTGTHVPTCFTAINDGTPSVAELEQPWRAPTGERVER